MIKVVIIEDEVKAADMLQIMLQKNHTDVAVVDKCNDLPSGVRSIKKHQPALVFLDIEMPGYSGLQLLEFFNEDEVNFSIIFTTAFSDYAIKAFELSAIDYILKPIQIDKLNVAIDKFRKKQQKDLATYQKMQLLKNNLQAEHKRIAVPVVSGVEILKLAEIMYLQANGSYTNIFLNNNTHVLVGKNLKYFEDLIADDTLFFRTHRSYLVNISYIKKVLKSNGGELILNNNISLPINTDKFEDLIALLKL
jgi:two-component system LytT family response regulator